jgi:biopolymer transport protein ExbD
MSELFLFKNPKRRAQINLTSLIDCMFMLVLFFIVTTTFTKNPGIEINLPKISKGMKFEKKENLEIAVSKDQKIYMNGAEVKLESLVSAIKKTKADQENVQIFMKADNDVAYGFIVKVMNELRLAGIKNVAAITQEAKEPQAPPAQ